MKLLTKFFFKLKKNPIFGPFPQFLEQKKFLKKIWLCHSQQDKFLTPCRNSEKPNDSIPRKQQDRRHNERMDRPDFTVPLWLPPRVEQVQLQQTGIYKSNSVGLTKTYYITVSMEKISSIHKPISYDTADFRVSWTKWPHPFLTEPTLKALK